MEKDIKLFWWTHSYWWASLYGQFWRNRSCDDRFWWSDVKSFVNNFFYVDDALHSAPDSTTAIDLLRRIQAMLATANLRHPKIAPIHAEVMENFLPDDHASGLHKLDFSKGPVPMQQSLGSVQGLILSPSKGC